MRKLEVVAPSARAAPAALRGATRFAIQKDGRSGFFRALRRAPPRTHRLGFPGYMRRGRDRHLAFETPGSLIARPVSLVAAGNVNSGQRAIWGSGSTCSSRLGWCKNAPILASGRPPGRPHPDLGRGLKPYCLTAVGNSCGVCGPLATPAPVNRRLGASPGG